MVPLPFLSYCRLTLFDMGGLMFLATVPKRLGGGS